MLGDLISAGANLIGGFLSRESNEKQAEANRALQREFAQSGIQWKVADAKKAGIHPIYAMGAPTISPAVSIAADPLGPAIGRAGEHLGRVIDGQDTSRAAIATASQSARQADFNEAMAGLSLERAKLQNDVLKAELASRVSRVGRGGQVGPPIPSDGAPFPVTENPKPEQRPPLMFGGRRWRTSPDTSPMKAWEDQYGDEGPVAATLPMLIMWNDFIANYGQPATWPKQVMQELGRRVQGEFDFGGNPRAPKKLR